MTDSASTQPAGWYHAHGDPPGTQRYWDGHQWVGGPQAAQDSVEPGGYGAGYDQPISYPGSGTGGRPATYGSRFVAYLIDWLASFGVAIVGFAIAFGLGLAANAISETLGSVVFVVGVLIAGLVFPIWNMVVRQGSTGQTIGKSQQNIKLVADATSAPVGAGKAFVRYLLGSLLTSFCYIDLLWPLWDEQNKRLTDKIMDLSVVDA